MAIHVKAVWSRAVAGSEDVAVCTFDLSSQNALVAAGADAITAHFTTWWGQLRPNYRPSTKLQELRFYDDYNGDGTPGDVDFVRAVNSAGTGSGALLPPQCACSVTEELYQGGLGIVDERKHWGRFYLPAPDVNTIGLEGRFTSAFVTLVADQTQALYNNLITLGFPPIIWINPPSDPGPPVAAHVNGIRVDDIVDIIRRRRYETFTLRLLRDLAQ